MSSDFAPSDISTWIRGLQYGQAAGIEEAWSRFFSELVQLVGKRVRGIPRTLVDPEEIVLSVFESAWRASHEGRLSSVRNCDEMWWWLLRVVHFKTADHLRKSGKVSAGGRAKHVPIDDQILTLLADEPNAEYCAILEEEYARGLAALPDDQFRRIAVLRIEGYTNQEIGELLKIAPATVTRKLKLIRDCWSREME